jgi:hypothetical protein
MFNDFNTGWLVRQQISIPVQKLAQPGHAAVQANVTWRDAQGVADALR